MKAIKKNIIRLLFVSFLLGAVFLIYKNNEKTKRQDSMENFTRLKSGNLSTDYEIPRVLEDIEKLGLNTINLPIVINIEDLKSSDMEIDLYSKEKALKLIEILKDKDMRIILEAYPWIANGSEYETDWQPSNINDFFWNWRKKVLKPIIDEVALPYEIDILNIGTGFDHMEYAHGYWIDLIDYLRGNYHGLLTYRTSWWVTASWEPSSFKDYEDKLNNPLFGHLDFISIAAYFELTDQATNSVENLAQALTSTQIYDRRQNVKKEIKAFYTKWDKPIFLGELGFPRTTKASIHPWNPYQSQLIDNEEQARCFEAYRRVFEKEDWLAGFSIFAIGEKGQDKIYYPSNESILVIREWYDDSL